VISVDDETKSKKTRKTLEILVTVLLLITCLFLLSVYGECAASLALAISMTSLILYSCLFDKEFKNGIKESFFPIFSILAWILLIVVLWIAALAFCLS